ncbi:MAG: hypothetical protein GEU94_05960, partial [Micromonosporaceae bacterium]|nr:hypothetical protein [Micromonosporaceae bacterium]
MGVWDLTRRLDQAVLPHLARAITWCTRGAVRRRALVGATVCASAGLLVASVWAAHEPLPRDDPASVVRVGMERGQSPGAYAQAAGQKLEQLGDRAGETYALVSFSAYLASDRLVGAISEMSTYRVHARAWIPHGDTDVVEITVNPRSSNVGAAMRQIADRKDEQARTYR